MWKIQTKQYQKIDALFSCLLYAGMMGAFYLMGRYFNQLGDKLSGLQFYLVESMEGAVVVLLIFLLCKIRGQKADSVGVAKEQLKKSLPDSCLAIGIIFGVAVVMFILGGRTRYDFGKSVLRFCYYVFVIAGVEEISFRGYIGPRIYGAFHGKIWTYFAVALMFSLLHLPFQAVFQGYTIFAYIKIAWGQLLFTFFFHLFMQGLFKRHYCILLPLLVHAFWDFLQDLFVFL